MNIVSGYVLLLLLIICVIVYFGNFKVSNVVRVPFEVVKQRAQTYSNMSSLQTFKFSLQQEVRIYLAKSKVLSHYFTVMFTIMYSNCLW